MPQVLTMQQKDPQGTVLCEATIVLSDEAHATIAHEVASHPDQKDGESVAEAWARHAFTELGINGIVAVAEKIAKYRKAYLDAKAKYGDDYKCAAELEAGREAEREAAVKAAAEAAAKAEEQRKTAFDAAVKAQVDAALAAAGVKPA